MLHVGLAVLTQHVGQVAPIGVKQLYSHENQRWEVALILRPENRPAVTLEPEPLETFPSEMAIAQTLLVLG